ncbi:biotin/lipoyl-binding protein, partial [Patescibacteria group bacterium]|nr:biotin/lipoyl-binding protein [Patescibacteria group bacterium]
MRKRVIPIVFLVLLLGVGTLVYMGQRREHVRELYYSGTIEATCANLAFQVSGRVQKVFFDEGQEVKKDAIIAELENSEFISRREQAKANLEKARSSLKQLEVLHELYENTLPEEVRRAEAAVRALRSNLDELEAGYRGQDVERARLALNAAGLTMEDARKDRDRFQALYQSGIVSEKEKDAVFLKFETALKEYERAKEAYSLLREGYRAESIKAARAKLAEGQSILQQAKSNLKRTESVQREVEAAGAQVQAARTTFELAEIQFQYTKLKAP